MSYVTISKMGQEHLVLIVLILVGMFGLLAYVFTAFFMAYCRGCCGEHGSDTNTSVELTSVRTPDGNSD